MKLSKTNKILLFIISLLFIATLSFAFANMNVAKADETNSVTSSVFKVDNTNKKITLAKGVLYSTDSFKINGTKSKFDTLFVNDADKDTYGYNSSNQSFAFWKETTGSTVINLKINNEDYTLSVVDDKNAPTYSGFDSAKIAELNNKLKDSVKDAKATYKDINGVDKKCDKPIGSAKYITIPSFEGCVDDTTTSYENMKYKVYYKVNATETSYTSTTTAGSKFQIPVKEAGHYEFYVVFIDSLGNEMKIDEDDVANYTLEFDIVDNYPVKVDIAEKYQGEQKGYLNERYSAPSLFKVSDTSFSKKYKLEFATEDKEENFKEYNEVFTEDEVKKIDFKTSDFSFKPVKEGYYRITCTANNTTNTAENSNSVVIYVTEKEAEPVETETKTTFWDWVKDHLLSVIFFGVALL